MRSNARREGCLNVRDGFFENDTHDELESPKGSASMATEAPPVQDVNDKNTLTVNRRDKERRELDRRNGKPPAGFSGKERRAGTSERRKVERRRQIDPTTCERDYTNDEIEFMKAMDEYKRKSGRQFPTWSEVLEVVRAIGYRRVAEQTEILPSK